ncbi:YuzL family protein [Caldibacillus lycopersici]|uniref:YuzL family protein n=1 Tax=Perspicuibacillus lycopersici TaxID=1325689 RepID=A0AAE3ISG9_9BACI|nr:YuzL family protein [Perspicuibacillus lycopersici]
MAKRKADASTIGLNPSETIGQGTTSEEKGKKASSARKKQKRY